ncbi:MAG: hypothetical protein ACOYN4_10510 [Bacteroidales bacterium]
MSGKVRYPVRFILFIAFILFQGIGAFAQQKTFLNKKISFTFTDIPLPDVLRAIGSKTGVKFSYNPELVNTGRHISAKFSNLSLQDVLKQLFPDPTISIREIGNQIVIYRGNISPTQLEPNQTLVQGKPKIISPKKNPDTVFVYQLDTLIIKQTDTIFHQVPIAYFDTIRIVDTVFVLNLGKTQDSIDNIGLTIDSDTNQKSRKSYFYSGLYFEMLPGQTSFSSNSQLDDDYTALMEGAGSGKLVNYSAGVIAGYDFPKLGFRTGVGLTRLGEKFDYSYFLESGGYYQVTIGDTFYTNEGGVMVPHYVIADSTWIPKDAKNYTHQSINTYRYLDLPFSVKYSFWKGKIIDIYAKAGINLSFLVSVSASHINPMGSNNVVETKKSDLNPYLFSWNVGVGASLPITEHAGIFAETTYYKQTTEQYKDLPVVKRYELFGIKIAGYFKF